MGSKNCVKQFSGERFAPIPFVISEKHQQATGYDGGLQHGPRQECLPLYVAQHIKGLKTLLFAKK